MTVAAHWWSAKSALGFRGQIHTYRVITYLSPLSLELIDPRLVSGAKRKIPREIRGRRKFGPRVFRRFGFVPLIKFLLDMYVCHMSSIQHEAETRIPH